MKVCIFYFQMHEAKLEDEGDCYRITLVMGKPGVPSE